MMRKKYLTMGCALLLALAAMGAQAGIIASATRVIFREGDTEKTLMLLNTNGYPIVAQTWVDNGDVNAAPELSRAPFVTLPSVFALPPSALKGCGSCLPARPCLPTGSRCSGLTCMRSAQPADHAAAGVARDAGDEHADENLLPPQSAKGKRRKRSRGRLVHAAKTPGGYLLRCHNRSAFYLSFARIAVKTDRRDYPVRQESDMMTAPFSMRDYHLDGVTAPTLPSQVTVQATLINDQGQQIVKSYTANP